MEKENKYIKYLSTVDTPMAKLYQKIQAEAIASGNLMEYLTNWRKSNPELAEQMREYLYQISKEVEGPCNG